MRLKIIKSWFLNIFGIGLFQSFWQRLLKLCLIAMNIGGGSSFKESGEAWVLEYVKNKLIFSKENNEWIFFDVGANVGGYSRMVLDVVRPAGHGFNIYAFEPAGETFQILQNSLKGNAEIKIFNFGLGESQTKAELYSDSTASGLASLYNRNLEFVGKSMNSSQSVEIKTLDEVCRQNTIPQIDFLKLDVEGHELSVLKGANDMLSSRKIKFLQFEFGGANIDSRTYFKDFYYLLSPNYRIYRILKRGLAPINSYREFYEIFITTNFFAELK